MNKQFDVAFLIDNVKLEILLNYKVTTLLTRTYEDLSLKLI